MIDKTDYAVKERLAEKLCDFLEEIGIATSFSRIEKGTFLHGIEVKKGGLVIDLESLSWPGDILHEAGHIALVRGSDRPTINGEVTVGGEQPAVVETAAIAWSFAAAVHLGVDPELIFHRGGYSGAGQDLLFGLNLGVIPGLVLLEKFGLTYGPNSSAKFGVPPFPVMQKWLRD
jgi:hypothetical protein